MKIAMIAISAFVLVSTAAQAQWRDDLDSLSRRDRDYRARQLDERFEQQNRKLDEMERRQSLENLQMEQRLRDQREQMENAEQRRRNRW